MLGCVIHGQGDLRVEELAVPDPGPGQALVAVRYGGVCGSDLHYWRHGGVGDFRLKEPMVLGHEVVGTVVSYGAGVRAGCRYGSRRAPGHTLRGLPGVRGRAPERLPGHALPGQRGTVSARAGRVRGSHGRTRRAGQGAPGRPGAAPGRARRAPVRRTARGATGRDGRREACPRHRRRAHRLPGRRGGEGRRGGARDGDGPGAAGARVRTGRRCRHRRTGR